MGIVTVTVAIAFGGQNVQSLTPEVSIPEPPEPTVEKEEPEAQTADPFADIADKVKKQATDTTAQDVVIAAKHEK